MTDLECPKCGAEIKPCDDCDVLWGEDAKRFWENFHNPKPNPARDETIKRAREMAKQINLKI